MVKDKGQNPIKQYKPMKPVKRGTKIWKICCSDCGYLFDFTIFIGTVDGGEHGLAHSVVMDLCQPNLTNGDHVVYVDNFFTAVVLAEGYRHFSIAKELKNANNHIVGTFRDNRRGYPDVLKDQNLRKEMNRANYHTASTYSMTCTRKTQSLSPSFPLSTILMDKMRSRGKEELGRELLCLLHLVYLYTTRIW